MTNVEITKSHLEAHSKTLAFSGAIQTSMIYTYINNKSTVEILGTSWTIEQIGYAVIFLSPVLYANIFRNINGISFCIGKSPDLSELHEEVTSNTSTFNPYYKYGKSSTGLIGFMNKLILFGIMTSMIAFFAHFLRNSSASLQYYLCLLTGAITGKIHYATIKAMIATDKKFLDSKKIVPDSITPLIISSVLGLYLYFNL